MKLSRRSFLRAGSAAGVALAGGSLLEKLALAEDGPDHFFLFIELKGGIAWHYATDGRDLSMLPLADDNVVKLVKLEADGTQAPLSQDERTRVLKAKGAQSMHGNILILPFIGSPEESYQSGTTAIGGKWRLGLAGQALLPHVEDIAVVRGVRNLHDFHGGANDETWSGIFSDRTDQARKHMAGTLAAHMTKKKGAALLDNVVFEGATFPGKSAEDFANPMRIDVRSLGMLAASQAGDAASAEARFGHARKLAEAVAGPRMGSQQKEAFAAYLSALEKAPAIQKRLADISKKFSATDASLDLDLQVDTAVTLFQSGLTRVATLCLGSSNGMNDVDGFGMFDAHYGLLHKAPSGTSSRRRTYGHYLNVQQSMDSLARLVKLLKSTMRNGKSLFEQTTVVVSSEFSRPSNATGNEDNQGAFGAGHYQYNNDFIMFGKGVRGGAWIGENDPITQYAHVAKMSTLDQKDPTKVEYSAPSFFTLDAATNIRNVPRDGRVDSIAVEGAINFVGGAERPIMPKDIMRTLFEVAGIGDKFSQSYSGNWFSDAKVLRPLTG